MYLDPIMDLHAGMVGEPDAHWLDQPPGDITLHPRYTYPSEITSLVPEPGHTRSQIGVSPPNAEAEAWDWEHLAAG